MESPERPLFNQSEVIGKIKEPSAPKRAEVARLVGGDLKEFLGTNYQMGKSFREIADIISQLSQGQIKVAYTTISRWVHKEGILVRESGHTPTPETKRILSQQTTALWDDPEKRRERVRKIREFWDDEVKKKKALGKIHTQEANDKRSQSLKKTYENNPDLAKLIGDKNRQSFENRMKIVFGENPQTELQRLVEQRASDAEIAEIAAVKLGRRVSPDTIKGWRKYFKIKSSVDREKGRVNRHSLSIWETAVKLDLSDEYNELEQEIIKRRILKRIPDSYENIGRDNGFSRQTICNIERRIVSRLENKLSEQGIDYN